MRNCFLHSPFLGKFWMTFTAASNWSRVDIFSDTKNNSFKIWHNFLRWHQRHTKIITKVKISLSQSLWVHLITCFRYKRTIYLRRICYKVERLLLLLLTHFKKNISYVVFYDTVLGRHAAEVKTVFWQFWYFFGKSSVDDDDDDAAMSTSTTWLH